jgi:hypothetical protein
MDDVRYALRGSRNNTGSIHEHLAALNVKFRSMTRRPTTSAKVGKRGGKGMGSSWDSQSDTRECYECGKIGHICTDCSDLPWNKKKHEDL